MASLLVPTETIHPIKACQSQATALSHLIEGSAAAKPQFLSKIYNVVFLAGKPRSHEAFELVRSPILYRGSLWNNMEDSGVYSGSVFFIYLHILCRISL